MVIPGLTKRFASLGIVPLSSSQLRPSLQQGTSGSIFGRGLVVRLWCFRAKCGAVGGKRGGLGLEFRVTLHKHPMPVRFKLNRLPAYGDAAFKICIPMVATSNRLAPLSDLVPKRPDLLSELFDL